MHKKKLSVVREQAFLSSFKKYWGYHLSISLEDSESEWDWWWLCYLSKYPEEDKKIMSARLIYINFLTYKAKPLLFLLCALCGHISCDQFLISMFFGGLSIGKKHDALLKAWARVFNAI